MNWLDEAARWLASPTRRLLLLTYAGLALTLLWTLWWMVYPFLYQRVVATLVVRDTEYAYQVTGFLGHGRNLGYAIFRGPSRARFRLIVLGRVVVDLPLPAKKGDARRLRARLLLLARHGAPVSARLGLFMGRAHERTQVDKFYLRSGVGLGDPALTGMAAGALYPLTAELPKEAARYVAILPMFDRAGLEVEAEVGVGFRLFRVIVPWLRFALHPAVVSFAWRWRFPRLPKQKPVEPASRAKQEKEKENGRQVLRDRVAA